MVPASKDSGVAEAKPSSIPSLGCTKPQQATQHSLISSSALYW